MPILETTLRLEEAVSQARNAIKSHTIAPLTANIKDPVIEVLPAANGNPKAFIWVNGQSYQRGDAPVILDSDDMLSDNFLGGAPAGFALWLFGPERVADPGKVYKWLGGAMAHGALLVIASEVPRVGKILSEKEFGNYSEEETAANLVRAGFEGIREMVEGPIFRLWSASRTSTEHREAFAAAQSCLELGEWALATQRLESIEDSIDTLQELKEFAILMAACHDLAGRPLDAMETLFEVLRIDPECARAMCGIGRLSALGDNLQSAAVFFNAALECQPFLVAALQGSAAVEEATGNNDKAWLALKTASDLRPIDEDLLFETVRMGNAAGLQDEIASFLKTRLKIRTETIPKIDLATIPQTSSPFGVVTN